MTLREITNNVEFVKWGDVPVGTVFKGFYIETKPQVRYPDKFTHYVENSEGKRFGLNGSANLDRALEQIKEGWYLELTYQGEIILESGNYSGKPCHQFKLAYDDERIHPLFTGGSTTAKEPVQYANSNASAPTLVKPESSQPVAAVPAAAEASPAVSTPQAAPAPSQPQSVAQLQVAAQPTAAAQPKKSPF